MDMSGMDMSSSSSSSSSHDHGGMTMMGDCEMMMLGNWKTIGSCFLTSSWQISTEAQFAGTCIGVFLLTVLVESVRRWGREWDRFIVKQAFLERRRAKAQRSQKVQSETIPTTPFSQVTPSNDAEAAIGGVQSQQTNGNGNRTQSPAAIREALFGKFPSRSQPTRALFRPTTLQQMVRSFVYAVQFAGAYILMLIAMSFNGYILLSIILGGLLGHFFSAADTLGSAVAVMEDEEEEREFQLQQRKSRLSGKEGSELEYEKRGDFGEDSYGAASGACC